MANKFSVNTLLLGGQNVTATGNTLFVNGSQVAGNTGVLTGIFQTLVTGASGYVPRFADNGTGITSSLVSINNSGSLFVTGGLGVGTRNLSGQLHIQNPLDSSQYGAATLGWTDANTFEIRNNFSNPYINIKAGIQMGLYGGNGGAVVLGTAGGSNPTLYTNNNVLSVGANHSIGWSSSSTNATAATDTSYFRDSRGVIGQRNGLDAQTGRIYSAYANPSTGSWLEFATSTGAHQIMSVSSGTGLVPLQLGVNRSGNITVGTNGRVGINNSTPAYTLDVSGSANISGQVYASGINLTNNFQLASSSAIASISQYGQFVGTHNGVGSPWSLVSIDGSYPAGLILGSSARTYWSNSVDYSSAIDVNIGRLSSNWLRIATGKTNNSLGSLELSGIRALNLDVSGSGNFSSGLLVSGRIGVGTLAPTQPLQVVGNIQLGSIANTAGATAGNLNFNGGNGTNDVAGNINFYGEGGGRLATIRHEGGNWSNENIILSFNRNNSYSTYDDLFTFSKLSSSMALGRFRGGSTNGASNGYLLFYNTSGNTETDNIIIGNMSATNGANSSIKFSSYDTASYLAKIVAETLGAKDGGLAFYTNTSNSLNRAMTISPTQNVGIGIASPIFKLDVNGSGNFTSGINTPIISHTGNVNIVSSGITGIVVSGNNTTINNTLSVGAFSFSANPGTTTLVDFPVVTGSGISGVDQSYAFNAGGAKIASVSCQSDNVSGIQNPTLLINKNLAFAPSGVGATSFVFGDASFFFYTGASVATGILPPINTCTGRAYQIKNKGNSLIISGNGSDLIFTNSPVSSFTIISGSGCGLINDGFHWSKTW